MEMCSRMKLVEKRFIEDLEAAEYNFEAVAAVELSEYRRYSATASLTAKSCN